jgi:hypothetical protein
MDGPEAERVDGAGRGRGRVGGGVEGVGRVGGSVLVLERHLAGFDEVFEGVEDAAVDDFAEGVWAGRRGGRRW